MLENLQSEHAILIGAAITSFTVIANNVLQLVIARIKDRKRALTTQYEIILENWQALHGFYSYLENQDFAFVHYSEDIPRGIEKLESLKHHLPHMVHFHLRKAYEKYRVLAQGIENDDAIVLDYYTNIKILSIQKSVVMHIQFVTDYLYRLQKKVKPFRAFDRFFKRHEQHKKIVRHIEGPFIKPRRSMRRKLSNWYYKKAPWRSATARRAHLVGSIKEYLEKKYFEFCPETYPWDRPINMMSFLGGVSVSIEYTKGTQSFCTVRAELPYILESKFLEGIPDRLQPRFEDGEMFVETLCETEVEYGRFLKVVEHFWLYFADK